VSVKAFWHTLGRHADGPLPPGERLVIEERSHWIVLSGVLLQTLVIVIAVFLLSLLVGGASWGLQSLLWCIALVAVLRFAGKVLEWWNGIIIVTDKRFMVSNGIIKRKNSMMPVRMVTGHSFYRSVPGRLVGYGTVKLESAGQKHELEAIEYLPRPEELFPLIDNLVFSEGKPLFQPHPPSQPPYF
jgi:membrane protein YdbS with pleckstrin-like domain